MQEVSGLNILFTSIEVLRALAGDCCGADFRCARCRRPQLSLNLP